MEGAESILLNVEDPKISRKRKLYLIENSRYHGTGGAKTPVGIGSHCESEEENVGPCSKYLQLPAVFRLDNFSDEVLFEVFIYLDGNTLLALEATCTRFYGIIQDHRFWNHMDFSTRELSLETIRKCLRKSHFNTETLKVRSSHIKCLNVETRAKFSKALFKCFTEKCTNLKVLELYGVFIDFRCIQILDFPKTLKRLLLNDCCVCMSEDVKSIFCGIDTHLDTLEELRIENSDWFDPLFIMTFSKMPELKLLSLRGCQGLLEFVPYGSMAARFGFKKLECLDVGNTPIRDSDIQCFNTVLTLKELYLECPNNPQNLKIAEPNSRLSELEASVSSADLTECSQEMQCSNSDPLSCLAASSNSSSSSSGSSASSSSSMLASGGNSASHSRFLFGRHRPDQIIYLDVHNSRRAVFIQHSSLPRRPLCLGQPEVIEQVDEVLMHPMFWDLINPLGRRINTIPHNGGCDGQCYLSPRIARSTSSSPITDRGICCFGRPQRPVEQGTIWVRIVNRPSENRFERLSVRHYKLVTDITLQHLVQCSPHLKYLDLTGTSVTREGIQIFKNSKPDCQIVANHLVG